MTASSPTTGFAFSSIPGTYSHLRLVVQARANGSSEVDFFSIRLNGDTGANYDRANLEGSGGTASTNPVSGATAWNSQTLVANSATANMPAMLILDLLNYAKTVFYKIGQITTGYLDMPTSTSDYNVLIENVIWRNTAAVTAINVFPFTGPNFVTGSSAQLYGIL